MKFRLLASALAGAAFLMATMSLAVPTPATPPKAKPTAPQPRPAPAQPKKPSAAYEKSTTADDKEVAARAAAIRAKNQDPRARALLNEAKQKILGIRSMTADYEKTYAPTQNFFRQGEIFLERPGRFRIDLIGGASTEERHLVSLSDGQTVTLYDNGKYIAYEKPVRKENFFLGHTFLVQFFFDPREIAFDPTDPTWGRAISLFDTNAAAYDKDVKLALLGNRVLEEREYQVIEIRYNTPRNDIRQQISIGPDKLIYQVDTYFDGRTISQKYRNFRINRSIAGSTWTRETAEKMPLAVTDPVRLGSEAPDFTLPGHNGTELNLKQMLAGKKGLYLCTFDGEAGKRARSADAHLKQMRVLQDIKNKFERQGLVVVAVVGGPGITPDVKDEMMLNWMPDVTRFNYPIAIDIDVEKGIQGSAYQNFNLGGRNNLLLDSKGRVVFAATNFSDKVNELAFYQALAQIGFSVSPADLEGAAR